jgi:hypothetical protein
MKLVRADPASPPPGAYPRCDCFNLFGRTLDSPAPRPHLEEQDTSCDGWKRVVERIEKAIQAGEEDLAPLGGLSGPERASVITLPDSIERLVNVRKLQLYASHLVRIPAQISGMRSLAYLDVYTSYRLHFFPYEITRCQALRDSRVSTRALYGNFKNRPPFPDLRRADIPRLLSSTCSICASPLGQAPVPRWITLAVGTDCLPLLVSACSTACVEKLPTPAADYVQVAHFGGPELVQPHEFH